MLITFKIEAAIWSSKATCSIFCSMMNFIYDMYNLALKLSVVMLHYL